VEFFDRVQKNPPTKVLMQITTKEITTTLFHLTGCMIKFQCVRLGDSGQSVIGTSGKLAPQLHKSDLVFLDQMCFGGASPH
jgi:hypothetical protein